jgi:hypothetical protein
LIDKARSSIAAADAIAPELPAEPEIAAPPVLRRV